MENLHFEKNSSFEFISDKQLQCLPKLFLSDLEIVVSDKLSLNKYIDSFSDLTGSVEDFLSLSGVDTIGFGSDSKLLQLLNLKYSELNEIPDKTEELKTAKKIIGLPKLLANSNEFKVYPLIYRHYDKDTNLFLSFGEEFNNCKNLIELQVSIDFSLFFGDNIYCAWAIYNPEKYISDSFETSIVHNSSPFLKMTLKNAFDLICAENVNLMSREKDEDILKKIANLHNQIVAHSDYPANGALVIIKNWLFDLTDKFYWKMDFKHYFKGK